MKKKTWLVKFNEDFKPGVCSSACVMYSVCAHKMAEGAKWRCPVGSAKEVHAVSADFNPSGHLELRDETGVERTGKLYILEE